MVYLEFVNENIYLYIGVIIALLILDIILSIVCINQRKLFIDGSNGNAAWCDCRSYCVSDFKDN